MKKRNALLLALLLLFVVVLSACSTQTADVAQDRGTTGAANIERPENVDYGTSEVEWRSFNLEDIEGNSFAVDDYADKPVLLEPFAVWCSNCKKQQAQVSELHDDLGDAIATIAIEIDPNAKLDAVASYVEDNGFKSQYVVAPKEFTQALVDEFGAQVVSAPSAPMIYICGDDVQLLRRGIKPTSELKELVEGCNA